MAFRVALAQTPFPASPDTSLGAVLDGIGAAARAGARLVVFPECQLPGYRLGPHPVEDVGPEWLEAAWRQAAAAASAAGIAAVVGTERIVAGRRRISNLVATGNDVGFQDKVQLDPSEDATFEPGQGRSLFHAGGVPFGVVTCHEGWRYPETVRWAARAGARLVVHPQYHWPTGGHRPEQFGDPRNTFHEKALLCRAAENTIFVASVNHAEPGAATTSCVVGPDGVVVAWHPYGKPGLLVADLDLSHATGLLARRLRPTPAEAPPA